MHGELRLKTVYLVVNVAFIRAVMSSGQGVTNL
jgi:hypothetical protein